MKSKDIIAKVYQEFKEENSSFKRAFLRVKRYYIILYYINLFHRKKEHLAK